MAATGRTEAQAPLALADDRIGIGAQQPGHRLVGGGWMDVTNRGRRRRQQYTRQREHHQGRPAPGLSAGRAQGSSSYALTRTASMR